MNRLALALTVVCLAPLTLSAHEITADGHRLATFLDGLHVETHWLPGQAVNWQTGERLTAGATHATHCSTFVAAACARLSVYILRPPQHGEAHLANAQSHWLKGKEGHEHGWRAVKTAEEAQRLANHGQIVVAAYENPDHHHAGHIAIVRPAKLTQQHLHDYGPQIIQAGEHNYQSAALAKGFEHHPLAWGDRYVQFYTHAVEWKQERKTDH